MDTQVLFYGTIILTALMGAVLGYVAISYRKLIEKYEKIRASQEEEAHGLETQKTQIIEEGRRQAGLIIADAQTKAAKLVGEAGTFSDQTKQILEIELKKTQAAELDYYRKALEEIQKGAVATLGGIPKDVKDVVVKEIDAVRASLSLEIQKAQQETRQMLAASYKKMEEEVEAHKKERLKKIDEKIFEILKIVATRAIGKSLSFEDHEDVVIKALEDAKRENVL